MANMATKTTIVDDIDGSSPAETLTFGLYDVVYEIDLNDDNAAELERLLQPYLDVARIKEETPSLPAAGKRRKRGTAVTPDSKVIRYFADETLGTDLSDKRGPLPSDVKEAWGALKPAGKKKWRDKYDAAH